MWNFPLFPDQASSNAWHVDALSFFEFAIAAFFTTLIFILIVSFAVRYRRGSKVDRSNPPLTSKSLEVFWIGVPLVLGLMMFVWGAILFYRIYDPPADALEVYVVGKQWMWKTQHSEGRAEINELHVPLGQADQADDDLGRRDPQLLRPGVPGEAGRAAGPQYLDVVRADAGRTLSPLLRRVLRDEPLDHGRLGHGDGAGRVPAAGSRRRGPGRRWPSRASGCSSSTTAPAATGAARPSTRPGWKASIGRPVPIQQGNDVRFTLADDRYIRDSILDPRRKSSPAISR